MSRIGTAMQRTVTSDADAGQSGRNAPATECRALAVVTPATARRGEMVRPHCSAAFITQLLAAKARLPQSRERRREEPEVARHVYEAGMTSLPRTQGRLFSRAT